MRLLILTQKMDETDPVLGFFVRWVEEFARRCEHIFVVCLEKGEYDLPGNVEVYSLGKEAVKTENGTLKIAHRLAFIFRFYRYVWSRRHGYDSVFVHMNQEYILLAGVFWRIFGMRVGLWYNHTAGSRLTEVAMRLSHIVFHTSPYAFTAGTPKSKRMPAGIDTDLFIPGASNIRTKNSLLFVGRIAPLKGVLELIHACQKLFGQGVEFSLDIYGEASTEYVAYEKECRIAAEGLPITFHGAVSNYELPKIYANHGIFVNLTPAGNYDKTVLEAMACGVLVAVSSPAFSDIIPEEYRPREKEAESLKDVLNTLLTLDRSSREDLQNRYRDYVVNRHDVRILAKELYDNYCY